MHNKFVNFYLLEIYPKIAIVLLVKIPSKIRRLQRAPLIDLCCETTIQYNVFD